MNDVSKSKPEGELQTTKRRIASNADIWARIGLLFSALCLVKFGMLILFREYLFEIHWRLTPLSPTWVNQFLFYLFVLLVGSNLWVLGTRCSVAGIRSVRITNLCVLGLGLMFILLTFHVDDKNYLSPVLNGILPWQKIGWYLAMDFCFRPPFLAGWILAYIFSYYLLARTGREHWMLRITSIYAVAYLVICLNDLTPYQKALFAIDCVGTASFLGAIFSSDRRSLPLLWTWLPLVMMAFWFVLFHRQTMQLYRLEREFLLLSCVGLVLFAVTTLTVRRAGGYAAWSWGLPFAYSAFLILINSNYALAGNYDRLLILGLALPHYFLGEFAMAALLCAVAFCYRLLLPKASLWWLDVINLFLIALALADLRLSQIMSVRLDWQVLQFGNSPIMMWRLAKPYLPSFFLTLVVLTALYLIALFVIQKYRKRATETEKTPKTGRWIFALTAFVLLGLSGWSFADRDKVEGQTITSLIATNPIWHRAQNPPLDQQQFMETTKQLGIQLLTTSVASPKPESPPRDLNVVLIFQESSYNKYLSLFDGTNNTEPLLAQYKDRMELFPNFFSSFAGSIYARFATFTGLYPVRNLKSFTLQRVPVKSIFEVLHDHGYTCSLFDSCFFDYDGERDFLAGRELDEMYDTDTMPGPHNLPLVSWGLREEITLAAIQSQIKKYAADKKKFFLTYAPVAPHNPFDALPDRFRTRKLGKMGDYTPLYLNSLNYMDWIITSVIDQLKESGLLDKTLIVITDDHGEMLGENGGPVGHGWAVTPPLANIPLIIMDPAKPGYSVNPVVGSQVDLLPTILDRLNIPLPGGQLYQGASLFSTGLNTNRLIYLSSFQQYGLLQDHLLVCGDRETETQNGVENFDKTYAMSNQGARTFFTQTNTPDISLPSISEFDIFQDNFIANYAHYCDLLKTPATQN
ncbi:MAG TPA: sulfatase-like hydrolase/transferase [Verrucomicrobiae bacterium]|nr:sulfatase-like hydrolase/transferase [Verrucomicrobiae bacterium]